MTNTSNEIQALEVLSRAADFFTKSPDRYIPEPASEPRHAPNPSDGRRTLWAFLRDAADDDAVYQIASKMMSEAAGQESWLVEIDGLDAKDVVRLIHSARELLWAKIPNCPVPARPSTVLDARLTTLRLTLDWLERLPSKYDATATSLGARRNTGDHVDVYNPFANRFSLLGRLHYTFWKATGAKRHDFNPAVEAIQTYVRPFSGWTPCRDEAIQAIKTTLAALGQQVTYAQGDQEQAAGRITRATTTEAVAKVDARFDDELGELIVQTIQGHSNQEALTTALLAAHRIGINRRKLTELAVAATHGVRS
jgi:hypothetical protein